MALTSPSGAEPERFAVEGNRLYFDASIPFSNRTSHGIGEADDSELLYHLEHEPEIDTVVLNAPGGSIAVAEAMSQVIEQFGADTEVQGRCLSACTLIFLGGKRRTLAKGSLLGFHRSYVEVPTLSVGRPTFTTDDVSSEYDVGEDAALQSVHFMLKHGVDIQFALKALTYERGDMWIPSREELRAAGVLTEP